LLLISLGLFCLLGWGLWVMIHTAVHLAGFAGCLVAEGDCAGWCEAPFPEASGPVVGRPEGLPGRSGLEQRFLGGVPNAPINLH
jgi:hypothetical protein